MLSADYFDGRSTRVHTVGLRWDDWGLVIQGDGVDLQVPWDEVRVDERLGRASRRLRFSDGSFCAVRDLEALDALLTSIDRRDGWVDRLQRHWQSVVGALVASALLAVSAGVWLVPWVAAKAAQMLPPAIGRQLSEHALPLLDGRILFPSQLPKDRQRALSDQFHTIRLPGGGTAGTQILFRRSPQLGANAFTMPDGTMVVLDDLIAILDDDRQILAAFVHEEGHAHGNHGLRLLLQSSIVGTFLAFYVGDISSLLAVAPATLMQTSYSRDLELQADDYAAAVLSFNGLSPRLLSEALKKLSASRPGAELGYLATHPAVAERVHRLEERSR